MKRTGYISHISLLLVSCLCITSCSRKVLKVADIDASRELYMSGMQKLEADDLKAAEEDFNKSVSLYKTSPYGLTGLACLEMKRLNYKQALKHANRALKEDDTFPDAHAIKGCIITRRMRGKNWYDEAVRSFSKALSLDPQNEKALFFLAECNLKAQKYQEVSEHLKQVIAIDGMYADRAKKYHDIVTRILRIVPISRTCGSIALDENIDRTDISMLLVDELGIRELLRRQRPDLFGRLYNNDLTVSNRHITTPHDINGHRGKQHILNIIPLDITGVTVLPNGYFYPDKLLNRAQLAMAIQDILVMMSNDPGLATRYIGTVSGIPDVRSDFYAYNAISLCVEKDIMAVNEATGDFRPATPVSGIEAVEIIHWLKDILTMERKESNENE